MLRSTTTTGRIRPLASAAANARVAPSLVDGVNVPIVNFDFGEIRARPGETVRFANADSVPHTVTSGTAHDPTGDFDSGLLGTGDTYDVTFDTPGQYALFCVLHPEMQATVVVS